MSISKKRAPKTDDPQMDRIISTIYDDLNEIINAVNQGSTSEEKKGYQGKSGDIRLAKEANGTYEIQGRTDEGWAFVAMSFKEKS
tara:strand:- start:5837 stop:6091 length:255 start_codon:yes stop_codon:yes gene_type:complete